MTTSSDSELAADLSRASDIDRLRLVLLRIARRIRTNSISSITPSQLAVLGTVLRHGRLTVGQIADYEHVKPPSVSKIVAALESLGYVERATDPNDRRCTFITVTTAGHTYADEIRSAGRTWLAGQVDVMSPTDITAIESALPALERLLGGGE
ncbi:MAG: MarR family transcriptional regulator [Ilumatobacteraceae bacterium]